ncbi:hypothetical protein [Nonomuraea guangzhouensis]|uniref:Uncharacterized protein n=1 Tax=Nonomuraea guangzhouensis TaxID=1291555 RepID=A0ABW4H033_9ACTN|nr:hypothetical protein [Nonomuraea guangzhouensis]
MKWFDEIGGHQSRMSDKRGHSCVTQEQRGHYGLSRRRYARIDHGDVNVDTHRALAPDDCFRREEPYDMKGLTVDGRRIVAYQNDWNGIHYSSLLN